MSCVMHRYPFQRHLRQPVEGMHVSRARVRKARAGRKIGSASASPMTNICLDVLRAADPVLAQEVQQGLRDCVEKDTLSSYGTGARDWLRFCADRGIVPWPPPVIAYCGWLHQTAKRIKMTSIDMYKAGVRNACILEGHGWPLENDLLVQRTLRYLRKTYPVEAKGRKVPVTVAVLKLILRSLPHWPDMARMSPEDRVFAVASVFGVAGFLRASEFLASSKRKARLLKSDVSVRRVSGRCAVVLRIMQPKTQKWLLAASVPVFEHSEDDEFCPVRLWRAFTALRGVSLPSDHALSLGGKAITRDFMVVKTTGLMAAAGVSFVDSDGASMNMKASSWRAGAASSARLMGVPDRDIMALGRWSSKAWEAYVMQLPPCLEGSARSIWAMGPLVPAPRSSGLQVAEFDVGGIFMEVVKELGELSVC